MYITKIGINYNDNNKNKPYFAAKLSEEYLIKAFEEIAASKSDIVEKYRLYLKDMQKGSNISPERKAEIDNLLRSKLEKASSFDFEKEKEKLKESIEYKESEKTSNIIDSLKKLIKKMINDEPGKVHPKMQKLIEKDRDLSFFKKFKYEFTLYLELTPKSVEAKESKEKTPELEDILKQIGLEKYGLDMSKQSDNIETKGVSIMDSINLSTNKASVTSQGVAPNSQAQQTIKTSELKEDTFEREDKSKMSQEKKAAIVAVVIGVATYIATRGRNEKAGKQVTNALQKGSKEIVNSARKPIEETEDILAQYKKAKEKVNKQPDWKDMTKEEIAEWNTYYREVYYPIKDKIKEKNISTIEKKQFSSNPNEEVKEKEEYLRSVLSRVRDSEASYYDAMTEFEKYGRKESLFEGYTTNITYFNTKFPEKPSEKTVNKFMDICEEFGKSMSLDKYGDLDNHTDGLNFMSVMSRKGAITSIEQLKRALEKGKKIIWSNRSIRNLEWTLMKAEDAPYKNNKEVKEILQKFSDTAYENKKPFIKTFFEKHGDPNELEHIIL